MSHIFDDSPTRGPPTGRRRDILNQKYDHIGVCLDAILSRAEKGMEEIRIAVAEAKEAVEQRRHLILRNNVDEEDLDVNILNDQGDWRSGRAAAEPSKALHSRISIQMTKSSL